MIPTGFHFLRPEWLWAFLPAALLLWLALRHLGQDRNSSWVGLVDAHLLQQLAVRGETAGRRRWHGMAIGAGMVAAILAMAGPAWQKLPVPAYRGDNPTVLVLSLAQSMNGDDLVPSRLARAEHKLRDMLDRANGDDVALIIYADQPFVAAPLTGDGAVIRQMLPELSTSLMPVLGNRLDLAIDRARELLTNSNAHRGRIIVLADDTGLDPERSLNAAKSAQAAGFDISVLGVGTEAGARLQTDSGRTIRGTDGAGVTAKLDLAGLRALANAGGGQFAQVTPGNEDIIRLMPDNQGDSAGTGPAIGQAADRWNDKGYLLVIVPVLLLPLAFRRGVLFGLVIATLGFGVAPQGARAASWADLWQTPDQQAQAAFDAGDYRTAAGKFSDAGAKGAAKYRAGDYTGASELFGNDPYNRGNALARAGAFEQALTAYDQALEAAPDDADAQFNRDLVEKLLERQRQEAQQQEAQQQQDQQQDGQPEQDRQQAGQQQSGKPGQAGSGTGAAKPDDARIDGSQKGADQGRDAAAANRSGQQAPSHPGEVAGGPARPLPAEESADRTSAGADRPEQAPDAIAARQTPPPGATGAQADTGRSFSKLMDRVLGGDQRGVDERPAPGQEADGTAARLDQAAEQQLRAVPDDPSGLLRARIRQHYARLRAASQ